MSVVFDEVVGTIAPEPTPKEEPEGQRGADEQHGTSYVRAEIERLEHRRARLRAD
jgi:hypothetical protein